MKYVIKRGRRESQEYDREKLFRSIVGTCRSVRTPEGEADDTAQAVCDDVAGWLEDKTEVTSLDIRHQAAKTLRKLNIDAAYYYEQQKQII